MGQTQDPYCIPILTKVLSDLNENVMVRHEVRRRGTGEKEKEKKKKKKKKRYTQYNQMF
jgi:hypothetical protein